MTQPTTQKNDKPAASAAEKPKRTRKAKPPDKFKMASKASAELAKLDASVAKAKAAAEKGNARIADATAKRTKFANGLTPELQGLLGITPVAAGAS